MRDKKNRDGRLPASQSAKFQRQLEGQFPGIEYGFRPASYWTPTNPTQVLANIKGAERKRRALQAADTCDQALLEESLSDDERALVSAIHPALMGGEYLPDYLLGEVEIARITMASTTQDVVSFRACRHERSILYRVVDEYENVFELAPSRSSKPLSLAELVRLIEGARCDDVRFGVGFVAFVVHECDFPLEDYVDFQSFSSEFYPQLADHYAMALQAWAEEVRS